MTKTLALPRGSGSGRRMAPRGRAREESEESGEWSQEREDGWGRGWHPSHPSQYLLILSPVTTCVIMITILLALTQVTLGKWCQHHHHCHYHSVIAGLDSMTHYSPVEVTGVKLPLYGMYGGVAELRCHYTSVMPVYSVKWYKNGKEFYRLAANGPNLWRFPLHCPASLHLIHCSYLPGKADPITIHNVEGITLDVSVMSDNCQHQSCPALMLISSLSPLHIIVSGLSSSQNF